MDNGSLNNEITLTIKNIDVTQANIAQLRAKKRELEATLQQREEEKDFFFEP